jgi:predicted regulator of Ras-like GTPase activity (Roadblock/LC7/MglB family)
MHHMQGHLQCTAKRLAMRRKVIRRRLQAVVDVDGLHLARELLGTHEQQRGRVCAAAVGDGNR